MIQHSLRTHRLRSRLLALRGTPHRSLTPVQRRHAAHVHPERDRRSTHKQTHFHEVCNAVDGDIPSVKDADWPGWTIATLQSSCKRRAVAKILYGKGPIATKNLLRETNGPRRGRVKRRTRQPCALAFYALGLSVALDDLVSIFPVMVPPLFLTTGLYVIRGVQDFFGSDTVSKHSYGGLPPVR